MKFALVLPFVLIAIAPLVGRWRANVWLKKHGYGEREKVSEFVKA